jgi:DNA invertase Pin-like site-specific DNA recombinase
MIFGYIRVSTKEQSLDSQKNSISRYCVDRRFIVDEWFELEISSRQTTAKRRIDELLSRLSSGDAIIVSELSRIGRFIKETLNIIDPLLRKKKRDCSLLSKTSTLILSKNTMSLTKF